METPYDTAQPDRSQIDALAGLVVLDFVLRSELPAVLELMQRYENLPMSLADACLVRMAELAPVVRVFTLDEDFRWHIAIVPHLQPVGTLEFATGCHVNGVWPEVAADYLRSIADDA